MVFCGPYYVVFCAGAGEDYDLVKFQQGTTWRGGFFFVKEKDKQGQCVVLFDLSYTQPILSCNFIQGHRLSAKVSQICDTDLFSSPVTSRCVKLKTELDVGCFWSEGGWLLMISAARNTEAPFATANICCRRDGWSSLCFCSRLPIFGWKGFLLVFFTVNFPSGWTISSRMLSVRTSLTRCLCHQGRILCAGFAEPK